MTVLKLFAKRDRERKKDNLAGQTEMLVRQVISNHQWEKKCIKAFRVTVNNGFFKEKIIINY